MYVCCFLRYLIVRQQLCLNDEPFKEETCLFYIRTLSVPRSKHSPTRLHKTSLNDERGKFTLCSAVRTQHITHCEYYVEFLNVEIGGT